jgi:hypothetical protein
LSPHAPMSTADGGQRTTYIGAIGITLAPTDDRAAA